MARKPHKKPSRNKPPTTNQRLRAQLKKANGAKGDGAKGAHAPLHRPDFRIDKAQALWAERRYEEAIWYYERALARNPRNPVLLVDMARAYALRYRYADAEKLINLAESLYEDDGPLQHMLGYSYMMIQQFDRAIECFNRFLVLSSDSSNRPRVLLELAKMHERLHKLDTARQRAEEAIALAPNFEEARYVLATIERRAGDAASAEYGWQQIIETKKAPPGIIADSWYQLASIYDKAGRYDDAFDALSRAKEIFDRAASAEQHDAMLIARTSGKSYLKITADYCQRWHAAGSELEPLGGGLALLTSHPRSGTTLLEQVLDSHPGVISADELQVLSELVYMGLSKKALQDESVPETLDRIPLDDVRQARHDYWNGMEGALRQPIGTRMLLDKNPRIDDASAPDCPRISGHAHPVRGPRPARRGR